MRGALAAVALLTAVLSAADERPRLEKGSPSELRGLRRLYVAVKEPAIQEDLSARLAAEIPELEIVGDPSEAEALLVVTQWTETLREETPAGGECTPCEAARRAAEAPEIVIRAVASIVTPAGPNAYRQLSKSSWSSASTSTLHHQIVQHVVTVYRKANRRPGTAPRKEIP